MTYTAPTVNYSTTPDGTFTTLTGVQSVVINRGRQRFQDPVRQSSCTVEIVPASSYATPLEVGQYLDVKLVNNVASQCYFSGVITDVSRTYGIPYNAVSGEAPADRITVTASGGTGSVGRAEVNDLSWSGATTSVALDAVLSDTGVFYVYEDNDIQVTDQTVSGSALEVVNTLLQTGQLMFDDIDTSRSSVKPGVVFGSVGYKSKPVEFADDGTATKFREIQYESSVQSTFNYISVEPVGDDPYVTSSGVSPFNALQYRTYSTPADGASLSGYLYSMLGGLLEPVPFMIATDTAAAPDCMDYASVYSPAYSDANNGYTVIGGTASITFRGSTVTGVVVGVSSVFNVDKASVRLSVVPSLGSPFTLDNTVLGVLDQNRLGFP
jgi:hypothetical protein